MAPKTPNWDDLEDSLLLNIFSKASASGSLSHCLVNKRWSSLSHEALSCLDPKRKVPVHQLQRILQRSPNVSSINLGLDVLDNAHLPVIAQISSALTSLNIYTTLPLPECTTSLVSLRQLTLQQTRRADSADPNFTTICALANLTSLTLRTCGVTKLPQEIGNLVNLRALHIRDPFFDTDHLHFLPDSMTNLHSLQDLLLEVRHLHTLPSHFYQL